MTTDVNNLLDEANQATESSGFHQFGKMEIIVDNYLIWVTDKETKKRTTEKVTKEQYVQYAENDKFIKVILTVGIDEFNENLEYPKRYFLDLLRGRKSDWAKTTKPSLKKLFGKDFKFENLQQTYVEVVEVPQIGDPEYSAPQIVRKFANKDECFKAWSEFMESLSSGASASASTASTGVPAPYTPETWPTLVEYVKSEIAKGKNAGQIATELGVESAVVLKALA